MALPLQRPDRRSKPSPGCAYSRASASPKGALLLLAALGVAQLVSLVRFRCERAPPATVLLALLTPSCSPKRPPVIACLTILWLGAWDSGVALSGYFGDVVGPSSATFFFALRERGDLVAEPRRPALALPRLLAASWRCRCRPA